MGNTFSTQGDSQLDNVNQISGDKNTVNNTVNDLSMRDNNKLDNVNQISGDKNITTNAELNLAITGCSSSSITVNINDAQQKVNDLSMRDNNKLDNVTQISGDGNTVTNTELALAVTGVSINNVTVNQYCGNKNDAQQKEPNLIRGKDDVSSSNLSVEEIKKILRQKYRKLTFPTLPWLKNEELLLEDYFIQLELQDTNETISFIFIEKEQKQEINWIYIEAPPGFGKTTLTYKLVTDWVANEKYVEKFEMAFLVILRHLQGKTVKTMLSEIVKQNDEEKVWKLINKKGTLIILDGLDEIGDEDRSKIVQLDFEGTIVITGRTGSYRFRMDPRKESKISSDPQRSIQFWDRLITITGIDEHNRIEFLGRIFNQKNSNWSVIKTQINKLEYSLSDLLKSPLMLILLVYVFNENPQINIDSITKTELYKNLINCLIIRSQSKINKNIDSSFHFFSDSASTYNEIIETFIEFGVMALENLNNYNLQFEDNEIVEKIYDLGLLIKHETKKIFKTKVHYEALHLSVIEFAVALSLWLSYKKNEKFSNEQLNFIKDYIFDKSEESLVVPFLCGLMGEKVDDLFNQLKPHYGFLFSRDISFLLAECHKNDSFGEAISPLCSSVLEIYRKPSNELLQLIKYGVQFKKIKYITTDNNFLEYLPIDLTGVNVQVEIKDEIDSLTIAKRKCKKINFYFKKKVLKDILEFTLNTFNIIDCEIKKNRY